MIFKEDGGMVMNKVIQDIQLQASINCIKKNDNCNLTGNILLLSDRLSFLAVELRKQLEDSTNTKVIGPISTKQQLESIKDNEIDYLIIVGYLEEKKSYDIIETLRVKNNTLKTVQWSILDAYIRSIGCQYNIKFQFDRFKPLSQFISYLYQIRYLCDQDANREIEKRTYDIYLFIKEKLKTARYTDTRIILEIGNVDISLCRKTYIVLEHQYDETRIKITKMAIKEYLQNRKYDSYINDEEKMATFSLLQQNIINSMMTIDQMNKYYTVTLKLLYKIDAFLIPIIKTK